MKIRLAKQSDKAQVLEFCKNTFSWGDYIEDAWDVWINEGNLFLIENDFQFGISHAYFSNNQVWIEGIRIHPKYRRKHFASQLITTIEKLAIQKGKLFSFMLTDVKNTASILLAQKLGYTSNQVWNFYTLEPKTCSSQNIEFTNTLPTHITHYVKSWRWLPLDNNIVLELSQKNKILVSKKTQNPSYAIFMNSTRYGKTLVVTLYSGHKSDISNILCFIRNFAFSNHYNRIEILTQQSLFDYDTLELKNSFNLLKKTLV